MSGKRSLGAILKSSVADAVSLVRQSLRLPHNKTRRQVHQLKSRFETAHVDEQRIGLIARSTHCPETVIRQYAEEFDRRQTADFSNWNDLGPAAMSSRDRKSLYCLIRALEPEIMVETGVGGGSTSIILLEQIARNCGKGCVHSIDIQGPYADKYGELIPDQLRQYWTLYVQEDVPLLPIILKKLTAIDFFLHDSRHTFRHMCWEYELAWCKLRPAGALASHDVLTTTAFQDFQDCHRSEIVDGGTVGNFGFLVKRAGKATLA